jgi:hypothetical protein
MMIRPRFTINNIAAELAYTNKIMEKDIKAAQGTREAIN